MENTKEDKDVSRKSKDGIKKMSVLKKLDTDTARILQQLKDKANKKSFG